MDSDAASTQARYRQVADDLRARLRAGGCGPAGRLPSELALARELGVSGVQIVRWRFSEGRR